MIRPAMHGRIESMSKEKEAWTRNQIAKRFKLSLTQSDALICRAIKYGVLSSEKDGYSRHEVLIKDFKFK